MYTLAGKKAIAPLGSPTYTYLNNPEFTQTEHLLTEIRIPVTKDALKLAGSLGKMTDIKTIPSIDCAVAQKPKGTDDVSSIYRNLYTWITKQGYAAISGPTEIFLSNARSGDYKNMKTKILIPVKKNN